MNGDDAAAMSLDRIVAVAEQAAREAGEYLRTVQPQITGEKSAGNLVTAADLHAEQLILRRIRQEFPDHAVLSEETTADVPLDSDQLWIVDPLDGTNNFAHQIPQFCVSIAFAMRGTVRAGVVFDPNRSELFSCSAGQGALLNGSPIAVAARKALAQAIVSTGFYYDRGELMRHTLRSIDALFTAGIRGIRRFGSAALDLCWVACGRTDGYFEYQLAPWDFAAGAFVVQSAGGICSDRNGLPLRLDSPGVLAASRSVYAELRRHVQWNPPRVADSRPS